MPPEPSAYYNFIKGVIESCENDIHLDVAYGMIDLFIKKFPRNPEMRIMLIDLWADRHKEFNPEKTKSNDIQNRTTT